MKTRTFNIIKLLLKQASSQITTNYNDFFKAP